MLYLIKLYELFIGLRIIKAIDDIIFREDDG